MFELVLFIFNQNNYLCVELVLSKTLFIFIMNIALGIISDWPIHRNFCLSYPIRWQLTIVELHLTGFQPSYQYEIEQVLCMSIASTKSWHAKLFDKGRNVYQRGRWKLANHFLVVTQ